MAEEKKRPWWMTSRFHGVLIMAAGIGMLFNPVTAPVASQVIGVGAGWALGGGASAVTRKIFTTKPPPEK